MPSRNPKNMTIPVQLTAPMPTRTLIDEVALKGMRTAMDGAPRNKLRWIMMTELAGENTEPGKCHGDALAEAKTEWQI
jgi:hypothetical protein